MACFCPLFSGSGGNCYYAGGEGGGILIDAGVSARRIMAALDFLSIEPGSIGAIVVTHEHSDHVYGLRVLASRLGCAVYSSSGTLEKLRACGQLPAGTKVEAIDPRGRETAGMFIKPFATSHDACESVGFVIETDDHRRLAVATDLGMVTRDVRQAMLGSHLVVLESNHDVGMVEGGRYPGYLKKRILSERGHLSNDDCASELPQLVAAGTTRIFLAHLSRENNLPGLACHTAQRALAAAGMLANRDFLLSVAPAGGPQHMVMI